MEAEKPARIRDASRSREAILEAAERLFAERGFDRTSLSEIAATAALSRGTPSYFFGSKEALYIAVLERAFARREEATREAFAPLLDWAHDAAGSSLQKALSSAVNGYLTFLLSQPNFLKLVQREELDGAERLREAPRESRAIEEAFRAVRRVATKRGLGTFRVSDAVLLFVSLTFSPLTQRATFMAALGRDFHKATTRRDHVSLTVDQLLHVVGASRGGEQRGLQPDPE